MKKAQVVIRAEHAHQIADAATTAMSTDDVTPILTGAHFSMEGGYLTVIATDRYRVHRARVGVVSVKRAKDLSAIVPGAVLSWLGKVSTRIYPRGPQADQVTLDFELREDDDPVDAGRVTATVIDQFGQGKVQLSAPLIKGNFPPISRLINEAKQAETSTDERHLSIRFLADIQKAVGRYAKVVVRHTAAKDERQKLSPTYVWCDGWFDALIQPQMGA